MRLPVGWTMFGTPDAEKLSRYQEDLTKLLQISAAARADDAVQAVARAIVELTGAEWAVTSAHADFQVIVPHPQFVHDDQALEEKAKNFAAHEFPLRDQWTTYSASAASWAGGLDQVMSVPLQAYGQALGGLWLGFGNKQPELDPIDEAQLKALVGLLAMNVAHLAAPQLPLEAIFASMRSAVLLLDEALHVITSNAAAERLLGLPADQIRGRAVDELILSEELHQFLNGAHEGERPRFFIAIKDRFYQPLVSEVVDHNRRWLGRLLVLEDVSHFKRLNENMTLFLQTVSHDLRSPLTAAKGFVDMLSMVGDLNERQQTMKDKVLTSIGDMTNLVEKVLDAGRLDPEMGAYELRREMCDPSKVVEKVVSTLLPAATRKKLNLHSEIAANVPVMNLDEMMLERALVNLVENAIKYTPEGGTVVVRAQVKNDDLWLEVEDDGLGIPEAQQLTLFERGTRVRRPEHKAIRGSGLGLFIVKNVAQQHGGEVSLTSVEGEGSRFRIIIPIAGQNVIGGSP